MVTLEELQEAHGKSQRLLESLTQIPSLLRDDEAWSTERRSVFSSLRRGLVDCITNGCLEAPIFGNRQIEDAFLFLLTLGLRSERRRDNVLLCFQCLRSSESWSMVFRGSRRILEQLKELPEEFRDRVLEAADASDLLLLLGLGAKKKRKKKSSKMKNEEIPRDESADAPIPREDQSFQELKEPEVSPEPTAPTTVGLHRTCPEDFLAENSLSVSDSAVDMASRTCPEDLLTETSISDCAKLNAYTCPQDLLTEPSLSLSIHSPEPEVPKPPSPALPSAAFRPPRPYTPGIPTPTGPTPSRLPRHFGGVGNQQSPASKPRRPGDPRKKRDFEELGPRCPNGKPMTREMMMKEGQKRREGSQTPTLRRLLSRGGSSPPGGADTPSSLLGRMKQKFMPSRGSTPSPASRVAARPRDFGGADRFGIAHEGKVEHVEHRR